MTKIKFALSLIKGILAILIMVILVIEMRSYLITRGFSISQHVFSIVLIIVVVCALWLGSGKFINELKEDHKNKSKERN